MIPGAHLKGGIKGGGGKRDLREEGVREKPATLRKEADMYVIACAMEYRTLSL
jgi:hypothetical protein